MKVVAIVQARLGSTRLPRKALAPLNERILLAHVMERAHAIRGVSEVVLTMPLTDSDLESEHWRQLVQAEGRADGIGMPTSHFSHLPVEDVLGRFAYVAEVFRADVIMRLTGDCPLLDPGICAETLGLFFASGADFASNDTLRSGYPDGTDCQVFTRALLERAHLDATDPADREHVCPWMIRQPDVKQVMLRSAVDYSALKLSVDDASDLARVRAIYQHLTPGDFSLTATIRAAIVAGIYQGAV